MPPHSESKHHDHDIPNVDREPPSASSTAVASSSPSLPSSSSSSPLDAEPAPRVRKPRGRTRRVREFEEVVPEGEDAVDDRRAPEEPSEFVADSPLDAEAEAALLMVEVDRIGPGEGPGWVGRLFDRGDGLGPQPVSYSRVGSFPDQQDIYERVQTIAGGGQYRFVRRGKKPVVKTLAGDPLPLPSEQQAAASNGALPNARGGFDRGARGGYVLDDDRGLAPSDPFDSPDYDPEKGVAPEEVAQATLNGWQLNGTTGRWIYYVNGVPSRPPRKSRPPVHLVAPGLGGYDPEMYDHSERKEDSEVKQLLKALVEKLDRPPQDPMASFTAMIQAQMQERQARLEEDRLRWEQEKEEREARRQEERSAAIEAARAQAKAAEEKAKAEKEIALARAEADKTIAAENAKAAAAQAQAVIQSAKDVAAAHAAAQEKIVSLVTANAAKADPMTLFKDGVEMAMGLAGGKSNDDAASKIAASVEKAVPSAANAIRDVALAWKGYSIPGPSSAPAPSVPAQLGQAPVGQPAPSAEAQQTFQNLQMVGFFVRNIQLGIPPTRSTLSHAMVAYGVAPGRFNEIATNIQLATPEIIAAKFAEGAAAFPAHFGDQVALVQQVATSTEGRKWLADFKAVLAKIAAEGRVQAKAQVVAASGAPTTLLDPPAAPALTDPTMLAESPKPPAPPTPSGPTIK